MSDDIRALVDSRWAEYGIGDAPVDNGSSPRSLRHLLRR
jgi:hypothetical protein